jgi:6-phosphogluconolactonase
MISTTIPTRTYNLIIGTYTDDCESKGIYIYSFDTGALSFREKGHTNGVSNPSYLCVNGDNTVIYCINEDGPESTVSAIRYSARDGSLQLLNKMSSQGNDPCYIINDDKNVIVANYGGGSIAVFGKESDGSLGCAQQVVQHAGSSIDKERQEKAHAHTVYFSPDKKYVFSNDLGTDKIYCYDYNADGGQNILALRATAGLAAGSGPRHLSFHPSGKLFAVITELSAAVAVYRWDGRDISLVQQVSLSGSDDPDMKSGGDIRFSPDGKFLYATNREKTNTITVFQVSSHGRLQAVQEIGAQGRGPRNLCIDPTGNYALVANENSNAVVIFKRDTETGMLADTGRTIEICAPVCLLFTVV